MSDLIERLQNQMSEELNDEAVAELARLTAEVERLQRIIDRLRVTFRVNMLRHCASATHDEITRVLDAAIKEAGNG